MKQFKHISIGKIPDSEVAGWDTEELKKIKKEKAKKYGATTKKQRKEVQ